MRPRSPREWVAVVALAAACAPTPDGTRLVEGEVLLDAAATPPADDAAWAPIVLPDRWREAHAGYGGSAWYRFRVPPQPGAGPWAVYLPKVNMTAGAFVDGVWVGDGGAFEPPYPQHWNRPLLFTFAQPSLATGEHELHVRVAGYAHDLAGLAPVFVGPRAGLHPAWAHRFRLQVQMGRLASVLSAVLGLAIGAIAIFRRREDATYAAFAIACAFYFVHSLAAHIENIVVPYAVGRWLIHSSMDGFAFALMFTVHRWAGLARPRRERVLVALGLVSAAATALAPDAAMLVVANVGHALALGVGAYTYGVVLSRWGKLRRLESIVVVAVGPVPLLACAHLLAIQMGVLPPESPRLVALIAPTLLLAIGVVVLDRFLTALAAAERKSDTLAAVVAARERELAQSHAARRAQERRVVLASERERIMREMHDGLGGRLVSMLAAVEENELDQSGLEEAVKGALDEMRAVIDSLDPETDDLGHLLGMLRVRVERRLTGAGLELVWGVTDLPTLSWLGPTSALDILRVVDEALTNTLKHARASRVTLRTAATPSPDGAPGVVLEVVDDGDWRAPDGSSGRGLGNMQTRASGLGGRLDVGPADDGGTRVRLWLPESAPVR